MANKTILICDDDEGILDMLEVVLEGGGYHPVAVQNSLEVYEVISREHPDLVLLDLWMPILSGDLILKNLRSDPQTSDLPVIVLSASREGREIAVNAGATDFVAKPFDLRNLLETIQRFLS